MVFLRGWYGGVAGPTRHNWSYETCSRNTIDATRLRSFDGHQDVQTNVMSAIETTNDDSAAETIDEDSRWYDDFSGESCLTEPSTLLNERKNLINWDLSV